MPALNFQQQFETRVELGGLIAEYRRAEPHTSIEEIRRELFSDFPDEFPLDLEPKTQTVRAFRKDGRDPKVGDTLYLYTGMRTKRCRMLGEVTCTSTDFIDIDERSIVVGNRELGSYEAEEMAKADGFKNWAAMEYWFQKTHGLPFEGLLIRWDIA